MTELKIIISISIVLASFWLFNHFNPWTGIVFFGAGLYFLISKILNNNKK